jgi:hypothetical protein
MANVFYLDVDDEITSAAARIRTSQDPRVGLVVPPGSRIATSRINFRLLAREALERNRALSIVSTDAAARALAASAGLPAFATVAEFEADQDVVRPVADTPPAGPIAARGSKGARSSPEVDGETVVAAPAPGVLAGPSPAAGTLATPGVGAGLEGRIGARSSGASAPAVRAPRRTSRRPGRIAASAVTLVLIAVVLGLIGAFLLPSATIVVTPKLETIGPNQVSIRADPNATSTDPVAGVVPAVVLSMDFTASGTFNATGKKTATTTASGRVTFTSTNTVSSVQFPAGSLVSTPNGVSFATTEDLSIPRARFGHPAPNGTVGIKAVKGGPGGNVPADAINQLPSGFASYLYAVDNAAATSGGSATTTVQIQKADTDAAVASLTKNLKSQFTAWAAAPDGLSPGSTAYPKTAILGTASPDNDPATLIGVVQPTFQLGLTASASVTAVDQATVTTLAASRLESSVAESFRLVSGSTTVTVGTPRTDGAAVIFPVTATARVVRDLDPDTLRGQVAGKSIDEARSILAAYGAVDIQTWPGFVGTVPSLAWRLSLSIDTSQAGGSPAPGPSSSVPAGQPSGAPSSAPSSGPSGTVWRPAWGRG